MRSCRHSCRYDAAHKERRAMSDPDKIELRLRQPIRRRLVIFGVLSVIGLVLSGFVFGVFFAGVAVCIVMFAFWVTSRFLRSELFSTLVWLFPIVSYLHTLDLCGLNSESAMHLIPFFLAFGAAAFLSANFLQAIFDERIENLNPMP